MTKPCARPVCGHEVDAHQGDGCIHLPNEGGGPECACPGFRTAEQQEAWAEARLALGPAATKVPARIVKRLLDLYP